MESKKINQLATNVAPQTSDLTIIGDPITGVSKKITLLQIANLFATTGTVTSVAVTETGDALTITGSPITSAGTINIGFAGDATQYVRGDGALADFPTSTGGGSSVSYYLNSSVSQGTIGGVAYRELSKDPISGAGTDITISANGYVASYITDANDPALLEVPGGNFNCEFYFSVNSNNHDPYVYAELYKYDGSTFTLLGSSQSVPEYLSNGTTLSPYYFAIPVATAVLSVTDRLAIRIYVNVDGRVVTLHTENNHLCQVVTTFSKGLTSLNNLTRQVQFLATGTSGTDFAITSSTATHTFNLPVASATNTGKLSSTDWSTFNNKYNLPSLTSGSVLFSNGTTIAQNNANFFWDNTNSFLGVGTNVPSAGVTSFSATAATQFKAAGTAPAITFSNTLTSASLACVFGLATSNNHFIFGTAAGDMAIANQSTSAGAIVFGTGTTEKMRMTSAGTFSIGNTNSTYNLDVTGTGRFTGVLTLGSTISNGTYTYTLPSATGTLALTSDLTAYVTLATTQTITGDKVYSGVNTFDTYQTRFTTGIAINQTLSGGAVGSHTVIGANVNGLNVNFPTGGYNSLNFASTSVGNTYTFPNATGTIALTSDLSGYLPLTGGTLTGALNGTSAVFSSTVQASAYRLTGMTAGSGALYWSSDRVTLANYNASGSVSIETGGGTVALTLASNQAATFAGALSGTSATFSTTLGVTGIATFSNIVGINGTSEAGWSLKSNGNLKVEGGSGTTILQINDTATGGKTWSQISAGTGNVHSVPNGTFYLRNSSDGITALQIASTGAATFSSSVTASSSTTGTQVMANFAAANYSSPSSTTYIQIGTQYGDGSSRIGSINTTGNQSALVFQSHSATADVWNDAMYINGSGNVGIGTTSPGANKFYVSTAGSSTATFNCTRNAGVDDFNIITLFGSANNNTSTYHILCATGGADKLYVYGNGNVVNTNNSYGTLSDATLKENIVDATPKLADILQLKVRNFNLIGDENKQIGFIAQEFEEVFPSMVDVDGKSGKKAIKTSVLVPMLVKAIQELKAEIDELKNKII